jgi:hypothetical protein
MTDYEKRALIAASGEVLCEHLPENFDDPDWADQNGNDINSWVIQNAWEPFQHCAVGELWDLIEDIARTIKKFHEAEQGLT